MGLTTAIIGYSGHAYSVLDACLQSDIFVTEYCERKDIAFNPFNLRYVGDEGDKAFDWNRFQQFVLGIGDNTIREEVYTKLKNKNKEVLNVVDNSSIIKSLVRMGDGNFIASRAVLNTLTTIGNACIINTGAIVEHECCIGDFVHIGPGAVLAGQVTIGNKTFIGANAVIKQGVKVGANVIIGAGSVVLKDVEDNVVWVGNPAKKLKDI